MVSIGFEEDALPVVDVLGIHWPIMLMLRYPTMAWSYPNVRNERTIIFSGHLSERLIITSNFDLYYEDMELHIYQKDTSFLVTEKDVNVDGIYLNALTGIQYKVGEMALHHKGEPLPGGFPKWLPHPYMTNVGSTGIPDTSRFPKGTMALSDIEHSKSTRPYGATRVVRYFHCEVPLGRPRIGVGGALCNK